MASLFLQKHLWNGLESRMVFMNRITVYLISFSLYKALMEIADYVKDKELRKSLGPKITPIERLTKDLHQMLILWVV